MGGVPTEVVHSLCPQRCSWESGTGNPNPAAPGPARGLCGQQLRGRDSSFSRPCGASLRAASARPTAAQLGGSRGPERLCPRPPASGAPAPPPRSGPGPVPLRSDGERLRGRLPSQLSALLAGSPAPPAGAPGPRTHPSGFPSQRPQSPASATPFPLCALAAPRGHGGDANCGFLSFWNPGNASSRSWRNCRSASYSRLTGTPHSSRLGPPFWPQQLQEEREGLEAEE